MEEKNNELLSGDLEKLKGKLKDLNQKVRKHSPSPQKPERFLENPVFQSSPENLKDLSLQGKRSKFRVINEYLRRRLSKEIPPKGLAERRRATPIESFIEKSMAAGEAPPGKAPIAGLPQVEQFEEQGVLGRLGVGFDLGTTYLVAIRELEGERTVAKNERNAFLSVRSDPATQELLEKLKIKYVSLEKQTYVLGSLALNLASIFNREVQRSMDRGILNPTEAESIPILKLIVQNILGAPREEGEICCFSIPADPIDRDQDTIYHRGVFEKILRGIGFDPIIVDEGYAVVLSELADKDFTGIGVSCGGGMVNVCAAFKSVPVMSFSITRGGDWIDKSAASVLGIPVSKVTTIKERGISLQNPSSREEEAIAIYYKNFIRYFLESIAQVMGLNSRTPQFKEPVDIVFAGGSSMVNDFLDVVNKELETINFGFPLGNIKRAEEPFTSVARGCLFHAINSEKRNK